VFCGSEDGYVYALDPTGGLRWRYKTGGPIALAGAAIGKAGTVYMPSTDQLLYALDPQGHARWTYNATSTDGFSSPAIGSDGTSDGVLYVGSSDGSVHAVTGAKQGSRE